MNTRIQSLLDRLVADGTERGLQVAAYLNGKLVVNASAGVTDVESGRKVDENTLFPVFSTTKGIAATLINQIIERGLISYDTPISEVWPEFGVHGKERVMLREALDHAAGVPQMPDGLTYAELCDWDTMCRKIADLKPLWPPGTRMEYHAMTFGWIVGEVARRVDGRPFQQLLEEEICCPLGITTMFVGIPGEVESRVAILEEPGWKLPVDDGKPQAVPFSILPLHAMMNRPDARRACIPASNGIMNALAIARHYAALLPGGVDGVELLPPARVREAITPQRPAHPENNDYPKFWGLGYKIGEPDSLWGGPSAFGHGGYGGSDGFADLSSGLAVGFTRNLYQAEDTWRLILAELRDVLTGAGR